MSQHDGRLLPAALLAMISCATARTSLGAAVWAAALTIVALGAVVARRSLLASAHREMACALAASCVLAAIVVGGWAARLELRSDHETDLAISHHQEATIVGVVADRPRAILADRFTGAPRWSAEIAATAIETSPAMPAAGEVGDGIVPGAARPIRALFDVIVDDPAEVPLGATVRVSGALSAGGDPRKLATLWDSHSDVVRPARGMPAAVDSIRTRFRELVERQLPQDQAALVVGMVLGDTSAMTDAQITHMRRAGLAHLTAVSGAHFAVVVVAVSFLLRLLRWRRWSRATGVALAAAAFALLVGPQPSVLRAFAMAIAIAAGVAWGRPARALPALSGGVLTLLALQPALASEIGLQLSAAAVLAIVLWSPHLALKLSRRVTPWLAHALAVPFAAYGACLPLLARFAGGVGMYTVPANVIAGVTAAPVTVFGLLAVIATPVPWLAVPLVTVAGACAVPIAWASEAFAGAPGAWIAWPEGVAGSALALAVLAVTIAATTVGRVGGWWRIAALAVVISLAVASAPFRAVNQPALTDWDVVACDVGQGDMMIARSGPSSAVVIDTGPPGAGAVDCLDRYGVRVVDLLIVTHPHLDHEGGVPELLRSVPVAMAWVSPAALMPGHDIATDELRAAGVPVEVPQAGRSEHVGVVTVDVWYPPRGLAVADGDTGLNDASIVVVLAAGGVSVLALGDLEAKGQAQLVRSMSTPMVVDVVKVAHHGSSVQDPGLAALITARVAVISVGAHNRYGHPSQRTIDLYQERATQVLRTDLCGDIAIQGGQGVRVAAQCRPGVAG